MGQVATPSACRGRVRVPTAGQRAIYIPGTMHSARARMQPGYLLLPLLAIQGHRLHAASGQCAGDAARLSEAIHAPWNSVIVRVLNLLRGHSLVRSLPNQHLSAPETAI